MPAMQGSAGDALAIERLTPAARAVLALGGTSPYTALVPSSTGSPDARAALEKLDATSVVTPPVASRDDAAAVLSGLWLLHDFLDESHTISQGLHGAGGSFWHAIMHRREGDFSNSKYWYARVGRHPVLQSLTAKADDLVKPYPADKSLFRLTANGWDPGRFVDLVEEVHDRPDDPRLEVTIKLQQLEWRSLFEYCLRVAAG
jgi:hypothetical protein